MIGFAALGGVVVYFFTAGLLYLRSNFCIASELSPGAVTQTLPSCRRMCSKAGRLHPRKEDNQADVRDRSQRGEAAGAVAEAHRPVARVT